MTAKVTGPLRDAARAPLSTVMARNSLVNLIGLGSPLVIAIFAIPPLLDGLGAARFGLLGMVWVAVAYLNLLDLGLGRATTRFAAPALRDGDLSALGSILGVAGALQLAFGILGGLVAGALAPAFVGRFLDLSGPLEREAVGAFVALAVAAPSLTLASSFRGILEAGQRFALINAIRIPTSAANFVVPLVGVWLGWGLPGIAAGMAIVRVLALAAYAVGCFRTWPGLAGHVGFDRTRVPDLLGFGGWVTVSGLAGALLVYVDRFVVGGVRSVEAAGFYTVPHEVVTRLEIIPASLVLTLFPALAALDQHGSDQQTRGALFDRSTLFLLAVVGPPLLALAVVGGDLLTVWLDADFSARAADTLRLLALGMIANSLAYIPYAAIHAAGRPDLTARFHLLELPIHLVLIWLLVQRWGIEGAAVAWGIRALFDAALLFGAARHLRIGFTGGLARMKRLALALGGFVAGLLVLHLIIDEPLLVLVAAGALLCAWLVWCWYQLLTMSERTRLRLALTGGAASG